MNIIKNIGIILTLLILINTAYATIIPDFQTPSKYTGDNGIYSTNNPNEGIIITEYTPTEIKEYITPSETLKITKQTDNTLLFQDTQNKEHGYAEVINYNGEKYIAIFWCADDSGITDNTLNSTLYEFNNLNNLKPLKE